MKLPFGFDFRHEKDPVGPLKIPHTEPGAVETLARHLSGIYATLEPERPLVIVCIGTDRSTGDALGPLVGTHLRRYHLSGYHLYGTLDNPVHAMNLTETVNEIETQFQHPFIIAIDACLGQLSSIGCIQVASGPLKPGAGVNKDLPSIGDMHVTGIVNVGGFMEYFVLQNTRLSLVMNMAEMISRSLFISLLQSQRFAATTIAKSE
ncbi:sporulation protein [Gordoniibacillus kamchatkensis]|uniref:Sporulation protein n=1 Tax=Gordoniibacillus kamchatkensis TaxID=1590651 RepID=A0ABR5AF28_9BACL|nr:spore protease YyaC [Paenibacillus sp. VKM B-2647]KIL39619.1 sporulation protein [Paenibacillus sp. VKM B-2647]